MREPSELWSTAKGYATSDYSREANKYFGFVIADLSETREFSDDVKGIDTYVIF